MAVRLSKDGNVIDSVESWFEFAPPKERERHWVDERSAKELAKAFCGSGTVAVPVELAALLNSNPELGQLEVIDAWPEHKIALDSYRGETRNADLAVLARGPKGNVAITIEAKADEPFAEIVRTRLEQSPEKSNVPARIEALARGLFGLRPAEIGELRYQLLHGAAASLIFAAEQQAAAAVFAVFEFCGPACSAENLRRNRQDLEKLVDLLGHRPATLDDCKLEGPFHVPGYRTIPAEIPLFIGKATRLVGQHS